MDEISRKLSGIFLEENSDSPEGYRIKLFNDKEDSIMECVLLESKEGDLEDKLRAALQHVMNVVDEVRREAKQEGYNEGFRHGEGVGFRDAMERATAAKK